MFRTHVSCRLKAWIAIWLLSASSFVPLAAQTSQLAAIPRMGWNSWNHFAGKVTDADVRAAADVIVKSGMRDAGYVYVNVDDTWQGQRDAQGRIHPNDRFPDMKVLADYIEPRKPQRRDQSNDNPRARADPRQHS